MNEYIIYCTEEQTKKALEFGAPIMVTDNLGDLVMANYFTNEDNHVATIIPTAEQMIGFLRSKGIQFHFDDVKDYWYVVIDNKLLSTGYDKNKELAAIDAALDYLIKRGGDNE